MSADLTSTTHLSEAAAVVGGVIAGAYATGTINGAVVGGLVAGAAAYEACEREGKDVVEAVDKVGGAGTYKKFEDATHIAGHSGEAAAVASGAVAGLYASGGSFQAAVVGGAIAGAVAYEMGERDGQDVRDAIEKVQAGANNASAAHKESKPADKADKKAK
jgi:hypothetical protein